MLSVICFYTPHSHLITCLSQVFEEFLSWHSINFKSWKMIFKSSNSQSIQSSQCISRLHFNYCRMFLVVKLEIFRMMFYSLIIFEGIYVLTINRDFEMEIRRKMIIRPRFIKWQESEKWVHMQLPNFPTSQIFMNIYYTLYEQVWTFKHDF